MNLILVLCFPPLAEGVATGSETVPDIRLDTLHPR